MWNKIRRSKESKASKRERGWNGSTVHQSGEMFRAMFSWIVEYSLKRLVPMFSKRKYNFSTIHLSVSSISITLLNHCVQSPLSLSFPHPSVPPSPLSVSLSFHSLSLSFCYLYPLVVLFYNQSMFQIMSCYDCMRDVGCIVLIVAHVH